MTVTMVTTLHHATYTYTEYTGMLQHTATYAQLSFQQSHYCLQLLFTLQWLPSLETPSTTNQLPGLGTVLLPLVIGSTCGVAERRTLAQAAGGNWRLLLRYTTPTSRRGGRKLPLEYHHRLIMEGVPQCTSHFCSTEDMMASLGMGLFIS